MCYTTSTLIYIIYIEMQQGHSISDLNKIKTTVTYISIYFSALVFARKVYIGEKGHSAVAFWGIRTIKKHNHRRLHTFYL